MPVKGKHVLVIGSQSPWLEAILIAQGADHVTTLEYSRIECAHPKITTLTPSALAAARAEGSLEPFDAVVTFSSLEHGGLGRYGDG